MKNKINIPEILYIEITNLCNANCIFCAYQYDVREKNIIDYDLFKKIILRYKRAGGNAVSLSPFAGEIFTDPDILKKINFIREQDFDVVYSYTNALLLHKFSINEILSSGLTQLNISLAPLDKDIYFKVYRNKNYNKLLKNLSFLLKKFNNNDDKTINDIFIEFRSNIKLDEIRQLDDFKNHIEPFLNDKIHISYMTTFDSWMGKIKSDDLLHGMTIKNHDFKKVTPCLRLNMLQVLSNGDTRVCGCRYNYDAISDFFHIGNAFDEDIIEMYNKEKVLCIKKGFYSGNISLECQLCSWYVETNS